MDTGPSPSVLPNLRKGFLSNFYHVIESDDDNDDDDEFRFNDSSIYEGYFCVKMVFILVLLLKTVKRCHIIESEIA